MVSAIIPCYNQAHYLPIAIDSVLGQSYPHVEIVVVDDGSTDDTRAVVERYGEVREGRRIRYVHQSNKGLSGARNTGLRHASGALFHFLDSDDFILPTMYERLVDAAERRPGSDVFHTGWAYTDSDARVLTTFETADLGDDPLAMLLVANRFPVCAATIRRRTVERVGEFKENLRACEDWDYWIRAAGTGARFEGVAGIGAMYRRHMGSMSTDHRRMWLAGLQVIEDTARLPDLSVEHRALLREAPMQWRRYCYKRLMQAAKSTSLPLRVQLLLQASWDDPGLPLLMATGAIARVRRGAAGAVRLGGTTEES